MLGFVDFACGTVVIAGLISRFGFGFACAACWVFVNSVAVICVMWVVLRLIAGCLSFCLVCLAFSCGLVGLLYGVCFDLVGALR